MDVTCNHQHGQHFCHLKNNPLVSLIGSTPPLFPTRLDLSSSGFRQWSCAVHTCHLACFAQHNVFELHPCCYVGFPDCSVITNLPVMQGLISYLGISPGEGNGYPLQYFSLWNPMDRGAWRATVWGCKESNTTERLNSNLLLHGSITGSLFGRVVFHCMHRPQLVYSFTC